VRPTQLSTAAMTETHLNLRGLKCPLPALKTRKALLGLSAGDLLVVSCTDPLAAIDIPNLMHETKDVIEDQAQVEGALVFRIRRGGQA
jgi:tRNA 2-thiouridine synthesizing protein A